MNSPAPKVPCDHMKDGTCALGKFDGTPRWNQCLRACDSRVVLGVAVAPVRPDLAAVPVSVKPRRVMRPPEEIPDDHDPAKEQRRMRQGGCCGGGSKTEDTP